MDCDEDYTRNDDDYSSSDDDCSAMTDGCDNQNEPCCSQDMLKRSAAMGLLAMGLLAMGLLGLKEKFKQSMTALTQQNMNTLKSEVLLNICDWACENQPSERKLHLVT